MEDADVMTRNLMDTFGLGDWDIRFSNSKTILGTCCHTSKTIEISKPWSDLSEESLIKNTVLHEIAHALAGAKEGHNWKWRQKCIEVGAKPERLADVGNLRPEGRYMWSCSNPQCNTRGYFYRRVRSTRICRKCKSKINITFNDDFFRGSEIKGVDV